MRDILPEEHTFFTIIKKVVRHRARQSGFRRIATPILEDRQLFERGLGDTAEAATKEMYTLETAGGSQLALRPEGTAGVCRAFIEHGMKSWPQPVELFYIEPFFRHDRPQKGRFRQFHQFGFEVLGELDPGVDAQLILMLQRILADLKIDDGLTLKINTIGTPADREKYCAMLTDFFAGKERMLSETEKETLAKNPLRLLDTKNEDLKILLQTAPPLSSVLSKESLSFFEKVGELLAASGLSFERDEMLVRGFDYYTHTVFEFVDEAGLALGSGGRYDGLVELLGGSATPAVGWAAGFERVVDRMQARQLTVPNKDAVQVFVAQLGWEAKKKAMEIVAQLREAGIHTMGAFGAAGMKSQLKKADGFGVDYAIILGEVEIREQKAIVRDMAAGRQEIVPLASVVSEILSKIPPAARDRYDPSKDIARKPANPADELLIA